MSNCTLAKFSRQPLHWRSGAFDGLLKHLRQFCSRVWSCFESIALFSYQNHGDTAIKPDWFKNHGLFKNGDNGLLFGDENTVQTVASLPRPKNARATATE